VRGAVLLDGALRVAIDQPLVAVGPVHHGHPAARTHAGGPGGGEGVPGLEQFKYP
jgi:hypothetical protein